MSYKAEFVGEYICVVFDEVLDWSRGKGRGLDCHGLLPGVGATIAIGGNGDG